MREYVTNLRQRFENSDHLARFVGVSTQTVWSWTSGRRTPTGTTLKLLEVLGMLAVDAPAVFDMIVGKQAPARCAPIVLPNLPPIVRVVPESEHDKRVANWNRVTAPASTAPRDRVETESERETREMYENEPPLRWCARGFVICDDETDAEHDERISLLLADAPPDDEPRLYGLTRDQWEIEKADDTSQAITDLSDEQWEHVLKWCGYDEGGRKLEQ
jgi:transcriptional regulator with XRE-family HTH domain